MFRSKGFTAAFIFLSILIVALLAVFIYLIFGKGADALVEGYAVITGDSTSSEDPVQSTPGSSPETQETFSEAATTAAETEPTVNSAEDYTVRPLYSYQPHTYPVAGENIPESGKLEIVRSGDNGEGLVFHKKPEFGNDNASDNQIIYSGTFNVTDKVYVVDNNRPYIMYHTEDDYYVTGSTTYVKYERSGGTAVTPNKLKVTSYGLTEDTGIVITVHYEDGNHVVFSVFDYVNSEMKPVLANVIAKYQDNGTACFEYHNKDGADYGGVLNFESINDENTLSTFRVQLVLDSPIAFAAGEMSDIVLHNN